MKDQPWKWLKYRDGMCTGCTGACCTMPVEIKANDLIRLGLTDSDELNTSIKKTVKRLVKEGFISSYREGTGNFMITQKSNDDCYFLDSKTRLCTVYERRPDTCREFPNIGPRPGFCPSTRQK